MKKYISLMCMCWLLFYSSLSFGSFSFLSLFVAKTHKNCPRALSPDNRRFCPSFKLSAECYCTSSGLPKSMCQDVNAIYNRMITVFGSVQKACAYQQDTSYENCLHAWQCYRAGGKLHDKNYCSGTGHSCA